MSTTINQNKNQDKPKRRLTNFRVKEVSLVDEAANGTQFLVVKSKSASQKDSEIFDKTVTKKDPKDTSTVTDTTKNTSTSTTEKGVEPLTFAQLVLSTTELKSKMDVLCSQVKGLQVQEDGQFNMGPDLTGQAVSLLEELSKMLFIFGSDSTLGFDQPHSMQKRVAAALKLDEAEIEKVGRAVSGARLNKLKEHLKQLESSFKGMKALIQELETKKEVEMTEQEKTQKEADLKKRLSDKEAEIRKELGLPEATPAAATSTTDEKGAGAQGADNKVEVEALKNKIADLEKQLADKGKAGQSDDTAAVIADLKKRLEAVETQGSNTEETETTTVAKGKEKEPEYIEKNGRKVKKGLFSGLSGTKLSDVIAAGNKKY